MIRHSAPSRREAISIRGRPGHPHHKSGLRLAVPAGRWKAVGFTPMYPEMAARNSGVCCKQRKVAVMAIDEKTRTELEAAAFRRLVEHLRSRTDVQNIDLMNFAGFCRNCLSNWMKEAADQNGVPMSKDESREAIYGMPFDEWKAKYQNEASKAQLAAFSKSSQKH
jgi:hypothetical protein